MNDADVFRQDLAGLLLREAASRASRPTQVGADLKAIALLDRLARDMDRLDPAVFARCRPVLQAHVRSRRIGDRAAALLTHVGVYCCPQSADDLVLWMAGQLEQDEHIDAAPAEPDLPVARTARTTERRALLLNVTSAFAVVLPLAAVWQVNNGLEVASDRAFIASHPSRIATVVTSMPIDAVRASGAFSRTVVDFPLDATGRFCRAAVTTATHTPFAPGDSISVVPRGEVCDAPLLPAQVGSPSGQFVLAGLLMVAGLAVLKAWSVLVRRGPSAATIAAPPVGRRRNTAHA